jgi:predicted GNAT family acetyltransferase
MEEVLPVGQQLDYGLCRQQLLRTLRNRIVFAVPHPAGTGDFVSKAGTNATGIHCSQLGGVYTLPSCRNLGYGFSAVTAIVQLLEQQKRDCVLFVKEKNISASSLYKTVGFNTSGYYIIAYYS